MSCVLGDAVMERHSAPSESRQATLTGIEIIALAYCGYNEGTVSGAHKGKEHWFGGIKEAFPGGGSV